VPGRRITRILGATEFETRVTSKVFPFFFFLFYYYFIFIFIFMEKTWPALVSRALDDCHLREERISVSTRFYMNMRAKSKDEP